MANQFKYDAFISYRHAELDKFVAENLHKQLEAFNLPKSLAKKRKGQKNKIERVFRDKEELPLTSNLEDPILQALQSSEWLIVICSPRLRESLWCKKEIETFVSLRGREHVLAVLIEGEPSESFPDELLYRTEEVKQPDGSVEQVKIPVEPLAADVRGNNRKEVLKAMKTEIMRILAAMFQVDFDDLRQRHRERRMRRIVGASLLIGAACLLFGVYSTVTALRIKEQSEQIEAQSVQILAQSDEILKQNEEIKLKSEEIQKQNEAITKQNEELALRQAATLAETAERYLNEGNRSAAIQSAVEALTISNGINMPYTAEAQYVLTDSLRAYDTGDIYSAEYQYETSGRVDAIIKSPDADTLAIFDDTSLLTLFDLENREEIDIIGAERFNSWGSYAFTFLGDDKFAYVNIDDQISIYDLQTKEVIANVGDEYISQIFADREGKYILAKGFFEQFAIYDGETLQKLGVTQKMDMSSAGGGPFAFADGIGAECYVQRGDADADTYYLQFFNLNTAETISIYNMGEKMVKDLEIKDRIAYVLSADYADLYADCDTYITAISIDTGEVLWENVQYGQYPEIVKLPGQEEATDLLCATNFCIQLMHMQTGEITHITMVDNSVIEANAYTNSNNFLLFMEDGTMSVLSKEYNLCVDLSDRFDCKSTYNSDILYSKHGITVVANNDKKITVYTAEMGPWVTEVSEERELPDKESEINGDKAIEIVRSYGLERPEYIYNLYYSMDESYCFLRYWDNRFVIYDVGKGTVINSIDDAYPTSWYLGEDKDGNTYLLGFYGCYVLNKDMEPIAWIPKCRDVDWENNKVYMTYNSYSYEAPLYNLEELLQIAEELGYVSE